MGKVTKLRSEEDLEDILSRAFEEVSEKLMYEMTTCGIEDIVNFRRQHDVLFMAKGRAFAAVQRILNDAGDGRDNSA